MPSTARNAVSLRILIVDHDPNEVVRLSRLLEQAGHRVFWAPTAARGFEQATEVDPDLVIVDMNLPDATGLDLLERIRGDSRTRELAVMLANPDPNPKEADVFRGFQLHSDFHWTRPLDAAELLKVVIRLSEFLSGKG